MDFKLDGELDLLWLRFGWLWGDFFLAFFLFFKLSQIYWLFSSPNLEIIHKEKHAIKKLSIFDRLRKALKIKDMQPRDKFGLATPDLMLNF
jgi:hypothetical protein